MEKETEKLWVEEIINEYFEREEGARWFKCRPHGICSIRFDREATKRRFEGFNSFRAMIDFMELELVKIQEKTCDLCGQEKP